MSTFGRTSIMSFQKIVGWCERCRSDGLKSPILLYPVGPTEAVKMCSNMECSDMVNGIIQADVVKIDMPKLREIFTEPSPVEWCDDDGGYHRHCVKLAKSRTSPSAGLDPKDQKSRTHHTSATSSTAKVTTGPLQRHAIDVYDKVPTASNANTSPDLDPENYRDRLCQDTAVSISGDAVQATANPFGEPTVSVGDSEPIALLCVEPPGYVSPVKHVYRTCNTSPSTCGGAGQVSIKPVEEPTVNICDSAASESLCADSEVCMDKEERVCSARDTSASTCCEAGHVTIGNSRVLAVPTSGSAPIQSFGANTSLCINTWNHRYKSHPSIHTPAAAVTAPVRVTTSSSVSAFDDSPTISPSANTSLEVETEKCSDTGGGPVFYTSLIPKGVTVKVVTSSERPFCVVNHEPSSPNLCPETKQEKNADEKCDMFSVCQMGKVLKVKIVATSEMDSSCHISNNVSTPTLLARGVINSWQEVMPGELEDEVNCAFKVYPHQMIEEPAARNVSTCYLRSARAFVTPVSSSLQLNTADGYAVKQKEVMSSPSVSLEHKHWERTKVPVVCESISRNLEKGHASFGAATESADSACATENSSVELTNEEEMIVPVPAAMVTNAAFTSAGASDTIDTNRFFHMRRNLALPCETLSTNLSALPQEQGVRNTADHNFIDSMGHCSDVCDMLSIAGQPKNDQIASETSELAKPLGEVRANTETAGNQKPVIVETTIKSQSQLDRSGVGIQESLVGVGKLALPNIFASCQEEQRADQHNLTVSKDFGTELFNLPNRSEATLAENLTIASEIETSMQPPQPLEKCGDAESVVTDYIFSSLPGSPLSSQSVSEAELQEQLAVVDKMPSVELPRSLQKEGEGTDSAVHCHKSLDLPNTDNELFNSQSISEASSPGNLRVVMEPSTDLIRPFNEGGVTEAAATSNNPLAPSCAIGELPCQPSSNEASLPEIAAVAEETMSSELPMSSQEAWINTEHIDSCFDPVAFPCATGGLSSSQSKTEGNLPGNPGAMNGTPSIELNRFLLKKGEGTASTVNCCEFLPQSSAIGELPRSHSIGETLQASILTTTEAISRPESLCNEQADTEGTHGHHENLVSRAATGRSSSPCRSEASSPEGSVVASETSSVELVGSPQKELGGTTQTDIKQCEDSAASNAITEIPGLPNKTVVCKLGPVEDPLTASLHIANCMWNMKTCRPQKVVVQAAGTDLSTDTLLTQEPPKNSIGLKVLHYTVLKNNAGSEAGFTDGCLSPAPSTLPQPPIGNLKRKRSPSATATPTSTAKAASSAGADSGTLQQHTSAALLQPLNILSNKPSNDEVQEGVTTVSMGTDSNSKAMQASGSMTQGQPIVFSLSGLRKRTQKIVVNLPPNIVTTRNTQTATVQKTRTKGRKPPASTASADTGTSAAKQSKEQQEKNPTLPSGQKTSRTGCAVMDKLTTINQALAIPITKCATLAPNSKRNAKAPRRGSKACSNKKVKMPQKWRQAVPRREMKQTPSRKRKGSVQSEQVVPDILQPVLSPTSSELDSVSSKPSKSSSSGTSNNAAGSDSTCKTRSSAWQSLSSCKSAEEYVHIIKNRLFPIEESGSGFPGYHPVLATRPPYNGDKKSPVIAPKRRRTTATTPARQTTEAAPANVGVELERYVSELSTSTDVSQYDSVLSELFDSVT
ncbi:uncharacterized protein [Dermacentor andersoni]|uniref:uncharacterized protein isoform X1 n=1 Tax=Dermacentor andersoni TaxID=34620 RepID=UPI002155721C|nr:uncharacterized protein LOC126536450 isoform X1 [Dermacentor andersoni]